MKTIPIYRAERRAFDGEHLVERWVHFSFGPIPADRLIRARDGREFVQDGCASPVAAIVATESIGPERLPGARNSRLRVRRSARDRWQAVDARRALEHAAAGELGLGLATLPAATEVAP